MSAPDDDRLTALAAQLEAEDPDFARRFSSTAPRRPGPRARTTTAVLVGVLVLGLAVAGALAGNVPLALMGVPVLATAVLAVWAPWRAARPPADPADPPPPQGS